MNRLPDELLCRVFTYLPSVRDLCQCMRVCRRWKRILDADNAETWHQLLIECTPTEFREDALLADLLSPKAKLIAFECAWNGDDHSENIEMKKNSLTLHRRPVAQSTDAIRGKVGFTSGVHYWTVTWHGPSYGSNAVVGVATKRAKLHGQGYFSLLGNDAEGESWGWDLSGRVLRYKGDQLGKLPEDDALKPQLKQKLGVILDMTAHTLAFDINGKYLGIAFTNLPHDEPLYPAISAVYGNSEISLVYHGLPLLG